MYKCTLAFTSDTKRLAPIEWGHLDVLCYSSCYYMSYYTYSVFARDIADVLDVLLLLCTVCVCVCDHVCVCVHPYRY